MRTAVLLLPLLFASCAGAPAPQPAPVFDVAGFFGGASHGEGRLTILFRSPVTVRVRSVGRATADGTLVVEQAVAEGAKPVRRRSWRIRQVAPGRYAGSLSDAAGPVTGVVEGNRLTLSFRMTGGMDARQWLLLQPGGRVARNRLEVRKWGVRVAVLDEVITKG